MELKRQRHQLFDAHFVHNNNNNKTQRVVGYDVIVWVWNKNNQHLTYNRFANGGEPW